MKRGSADGGLWTLILVQWSIGHVAAVEGDSQQEEEELVDVEEEAELDDVMEAWGWEAGAKDLVFL